MVWIHPSIGAEMPPLRCEEISHPTTRWKGAGELHGATMVMFSRAAKVVEMG